MRGELAVKGGDDRPPGLAVSPTVAPSSQTRSRRSSARACSTSSPARTTSPQHTSSRTGGSRTRRPAGRLPVLVPRHRGVVPDRAARRQRRARAGPRPHAVPARQLHPARAVPVPLRDGVRLRLGELPRGDADRAREGRLRGLAARAGRGAQGGASTGIGIASFTEVVGAGHGKEYDIAGLRMFDSAELRVHPTGKDPQSPGQVAGAGARDDVRADRRGGAWIPTEDIEVQEGDTDNTPYGLGTYASRSTPVAGLRRR